MSRRRSSTWPGGEAVTLVQPPPAGQRVANGWPVVALSIGGNQSGAPRLNFAERLGRRRDFRAPEERRPLRLLGVGEGRGKRHGRYKP